MLKSSCFHYLNLSMVYIYFNTQFPFESIIFLFLFFSFFPINLSNDS